MMIAKNVRITVVVRMRVRIEARNGLTKGPNDYDKV